MVRVCVLFDEPFRFARHRGSDVAHECTFCLFDLSKENSLDSARTFFVQAEMRALFYYIKSVSKILQKGWASS